jgi:glycosyltransferase involved in cell wall biosynthesis
MLAFVPMYNCERQVPRVLARISGPVLDHVDEVVVIDNGSADGSVAAAAAALARLTIPGRVLRNDGNYNLGGSHKVAFDLALAEGFDHVLVLHGDDQANIADALPALDAGRHRELDCLLGSRFSRGSRRQGYSTLRTLGNLAFNALFSLVTGRWIADLGSGLNVFSTAWLHDRFYTGLADDLTFNNHLLLAMVQRRARFAFFPISWREEDQVSNVRLLRQGRRTLGIALGYGLMRGSYLWRHHAGRDADGYASTAVFQHVPRHGAAVLAGCP